MVSVHGHPWILGLREMSGVLGVAPHTEVSSLLAALRTPKPSARLAVPW